MDMYEPTGDSSTMRPLVIYLHTGSFLPAVFNQNPTGGKTDSAAVEMCMQFARRGYVVACADYRQGWLPTSASQDVRTGTLLQAAYRGIQDVRACTRYFREDFSMNNNQWGIDTSKIIVVGQGTGGYLALGTATLNKIQEIQLQKFISNTTEPSVPGIVTGQPYVDTTLFGNFEGAGNTPLNIDTANHLGYTSNVHFVVNMGGALADSSWLEAGDPPMVAFHVVNDPFAPYGDGPVFVPTVPPQFVVDVSGSLTVVTKANALGNNNCFRGLISDAYTTVANGINNGQDGLFPFLRPTPPVAPGEAGPWEWYDSTALVIYANLVGLGSSAGTLAYQNGIQTNPDMSKTKALAYIDTVQNYANPRIVQCLNLLTGISSITSADVSLYPNPATTTFTVTVSSSPIQNVEMTDISGKVVYRRSYSNETEVTVDRGNLSAGIYTVRVTTQSGIATTKVTIR
jgi:hypothetical protein